MTQSGGVYWMDMSQSFRLKCLQSSPPVYALQWLGDKKIKIEILRYLSQNEYNGASLFALKGFQSGISLLRKELHGRKAKIFLNPDLDIFAFYSWNQELHDFFYCLAEENWHFVFVSSIKNNDLWRNFQRNILHEFNDNTEHVLARISLVFTGFFYDDIFLQIMNLLSPEANKHIINPQKELNAINQRIHNIIYNAQIFNGQWQGRVYILIDEPPSTFVSEWNFKRSFISLLSSTILKTRLSRKTTFIFESKSSMFRFNDLKNWLLASGYSISLLSEFIE